MKKPDNLPCLIVLFLALPLLTCCAGSTYQSAPASDSVDKEAVTLVFPDLPIPPELQIQEDDSVIITSPGYQGGLIKLKGSLSPLAVQNYFLESLPKKGWKFISSLNAGKGLMAFSKDLGGQCLITYSRTTFGGTEVEIWMAEPLGDTGRIHEPNRRF